jgi:hypothetical protein
VGAKGTVGAFLIAIVYLAALFLLVRPGSSGPTLVENVSNGITGLINAGTGGGGWNA